MGHTFFYIDFKNEHSTWPTRWHCDGFHVKWFWQVTNKFWQALSQNHNLPHQNSLRDVESSSSCFVGGPKSMNIQAFFLAYHEWFFV